VPDDRTLVRILKASAARLSAARWSASKNATELDVRRIFHFFEDGGAVFFAAILSFPPDEAQYYVPFVLSRGRSGGLRPIEVQDGLVLSEAETERRFVDFAVGAMRARRQVEGAGQVISWEGVAIPAGATGDVLRLGGDTTNAVVKFGIGKKQAVLKSYRTADEFNPEPELLSFLSGKGSRVVPRLLGLVRLEPSAGQGGMAGGAPAGRPTILGILQEFVHGSPAFPAFVGNARRSVSRGLPPHDCIPARLGIAIGDLHHLLSTRGAPPDIRPVAISAGDIERWRSAMRKRFEDALRALSPEKATRLAQAREAFERLRAGMGGWAGARKLRTHQDLHLGQVLINRGGFRILDFEGEPLRKGPERIEKLPPERDVATMLRSFSYAVAVALKELKAVDAQQLQRARAWEREASASFVEGYLSACPRAVRKRGKKRLLSAVRVWMAEKALYEIAYEAKFRPEWVDIPLEGFLGILNGA
jgi:maltose alpha-D-glucosyltransferase/alpha-amylase